MNETMRERNRKAPAFHTLYTFVYLPLSIALAIFVALGHSYMLLSAELSSPVLWIDYIGLIFPWISAIFGMVTLPLLSGRYPSGRRAVLFSSILKGLLSLTLTARFFYFGHIAQGIAYSLLTILFALIYAYYRKLWWFFLPQRYLEMMVDDAPEDEEAKEEATGEEETKEEVEIPAETEENSEAEAEAEAEAETEAENEEKAPASSDEEKASDNAEEEPVAVTECLDELSEDEKVKITSYVPSFFFLEEPLVVENITLTVAEKRTLLEIKVLNVSPSDFFTSLWSVNETKTFVSSLPLFSGKEATIRAMINVPTDRVDISLLSLDGKNVERKTIAVLPEKKALSSLSDDERFTYFLSTYAKIGEKRMTWAYSENVGNSAWLCPACGSPSIGDSCSACATERKDAMRFSPSTVLEEYAKALDGEDK